MIPSEVKYSGACTLAAQQCRDQGLDLRLSTARGIVDSRWRLLSFSQWNYRCDRKPARTAQLRVDVAAIVMPFASSRKPLCCEVNVHIPTAGRCWRVPSFPPRACWRPFLWQNLAYRDFSCSSMLFVKCQGCFWDVWVIWITEKAERHWRELSYQATTPGTSAAAPYLAVHGWILIHSAFTDFPLWQICSSRLPRSEQDRSYTVCSKSHSWLEKYVHSLPVFDCAFEITRKQVAQAFDSWKLVLWSDSYAKTDRRRKSDSDS